MLNVNYLSQCFLQCLTNGSIAVLPLKTEHPTPVHLLWELENLSVVWELHQFTLRKITAKCTVLLTFSSQQLWETKAESESLWTPSQYFGDNLRLTDLHFGWVDCNYSRGRYSIACVSVCLCVFTILFHWDISNPRIKQKAASYLFFSITFTKRQRVDLIC